MINTIFYFPNKNEINFEEYYSRVDLNENGISRRTIVFNPGNGEDGSGEIWKNGQRYSYGKTTIEEWVNGWILSYLKQAGITAIDLSQYAKTTWVNEQNFVKRSQIGDVFIDATYADGKLKFTRFGGTYSQVEIGRGDATLKQPLSGINSANLGTPSNGQGLVYDNGRWQYRSYGSGGATYSSGIGIDINNENKISLKPANTNEIGGIKISSIEDISQPTRSYEVKTTSDGKAYVYVPWEYSGEYMINVNPSYIPVQVSSDGKGNLGEVVCAVDVRYNNTSVVGTLADPVIIRNGEEISSNTALQSGISASISGSNIKIKLTNVADFESNSLVIKSTVSHGGSNVGVAVVTLVGTVKAPASGADSVSLQTNAEVVNIDWQHTAASPSAISAKLQIGTNVYTTRSSIAAQNYRIFYKYRNDSQWTLLDGNITINPQRYAESLLIELRKGSSDEYANTQLFAAKEIPFIVDPAPAIGLTLYKINVLSTTIKHKEGTSVFSGDLTFAIIKDDQQYMSTQTLESNELFLSVESGGTEAVSEYNDNIYYLLSSDDGIPVWTLTVNNIIYDNKARTHQYSHISLKNGQNYTLASAIVPFIMEGADGSSSSSDPVQSIQGTVMRMFTKDGENRVLWSNGTSNGDRLKWYTGDEPLDGIYYIDVLHYIDTQNNKDYGYFIKRGTSGYPLHAPIAGNYINYTVDNAKINDQSYLPWVENPEWEAFQPFSEAAFNALLAKSAYIESLTVAKDLVITDGDNYPTAGMTGTDSTITTADGDITAAGKGDIRIWAGYPTNNYLYNCPFYVTNTGELHSTSGYFENIVIKDSTFKNGSLIEKLTFERRKAYTPGANTPLQLYRRLYSVTEGELLQQNNGQKMYGVGTIELNTNHLFVFSEGVFNNVSIGDYAGGSAYSELHLLLPPAHHFIGQSIIITNESYGFYKPNSAQPGSNSWNPCITLEQENLYQIGCGEVGTQYIPSYSKPDSDYICMTDKLFAVVQSGHNSGEVYIKDGSGRIDLSGIWQLQKSESAGSNTLYAYGAILQKISLDEYAWIRVTAAEGYLKEDYPDMQDKVKALNAMWVVTGYAYKTVTSEQIQDGTIQRVDLSQDLQQEI